MITSRQESALRRLIVRGFVLPSAQSTYSQDNSVTCRRDIISLKYASLLYKLIILINLVGSLGHLWSSCAADPSVVRGFFSLKSGYAQMRVMTVNGAVLICTMRLTALVEYCY